MALMMRTTTGEVISLRERNRWEGVITVDKLPKTKEQHGCAEGSECREER